MAVKINRSSSRKCGECNKQRRCCWLPVVFASGPRLRRAAGSLAALRGDDAYFALSCTGPFPACHTCQGDKIAKTEPSPHKFSLWLCAPSYFLMLSTVSTVTLTCLNRARGLAANGEDAEPLRMFWIYELQKQRGHLFMLSHT